MNIELLNKIALLNKKWHSLKTRKAKNKVRDQLMIFERQYRFEMLEQYEGKTVFIEAPFEAVSMGEVGYFKGVTRLNKHGTWSVSPNDQGYDHIKIDFLDIRDIKVVDDSTPLTVYPDIIIKNNLFLLLRA